MNDLGTDLYLALNEFSEDHSHKNLTSREKKEYESFSSRRRKYEFLSTRNLVKQMGKKMGLEPEHFEVAKDGLGKPFGIYRNRRYFMSLAHSGEKVLCGISTSQSIGVDLEPVNRKVDERLRERMLHPDEADLLAGESLVRIWTLKEAFVKLEGSGIRYNLNNIVLRPEHEHLYKVSSQTEKTALISSFEYNGYWIAAASYK